MFMKKFIRSLSLDLRSNGRLLEQHYLCGGIDKFLTRDFFIGLHNISLECEVKVAFGLQIREEPLSDCLSNTKRTKSRSDQTYMNMVVISGKRIPKNYSKPFIRIN